MTCSQEKAFKTRQELEENKTKIDQEVDKISPNLDPGPLTLLVVEKKYILIYFLQIPE